jgi:hypothetical protein
VHVGRLPQVLDGTHALHKLNADLCVLWLCCRPEQARAADAGACSSSAGAAGAAAAAQAAPAGGKVWGAADAGTPLRLGLKGLGLRREGLACAGRSLASLGTCDYVQAGLLTHAAAAERC